jgi:hypothetical protein
MYALYRHLRANAMIRTLIMSVLPAPFGAYADVAAEALRWFEGEYAPHYTSPKAIDPGDLANYYVDGNWYVEPAYGASLISNSAEGWAEWLANNIATGWEGADLVSVTSQALNPRAVHLKARWIRRMVNEPDKTTCYLYLAAKQAEGWRFVSVVEIACDES